ncbi:hypothetical protein CHU95_00230 [Niveispirillum lacus]|uniref:Uncharacterized protein n=1 Tax=Niveispirillum lacus TaxID=1981099 RepID=A0A255ZBA2_9PROT|nr:hypothetical protein [Niveispirillum lacus]OYQ37890.1 hypothetical protein CHU95_00230 [Niveispirillum lacus]
MAGSRLTGRLGLLFAALTGVGAASIVGSLLRALPQAPLIAAENPLLLAAAPLPIGAAAAIGHIFWLRGLMARQAPTKPADTGIPARTLVPPPDDGDGNGKPRWRPVIRN